MLELHYPVIQFLIKLIIRTVTVRAYWTTRPRLLTELPDSFGKATDITALKRQLNRSLSLQRSVFLKVVLPYFILLYIQFYYENCGS